MPSDDDVAKYTRTLVPEQMDVVRKVVASCKEIIQNESKVNKKTEPLHLIVHGGPGKLQILINI